MRRVRTYWWFWIWIPLLLILGFLYYDTTLDIPVHDTFFVIANRDVYLVVSIFLFISGIGYFVKSPLINKSLTYIHVASTLIGLFLLIFPFYYFTLFDAGHPRRYYEIVSENFIDYLSNLSNTPILGFFLILLGIVTYLINLGFAIFKNKT